MQERAYSLGVRTMSMCAPGNWDTKFWRKATALAGSASQTTKWVSGDSANVFEKKLKAISDPIRPRPMNAVLLARTTCRSSDCRTLVVCLMVKFARAAFGKVCSSSSQGPSTLVSISNHAGKRAGLGT